MVVKIAKGREVNHRLIECSEVIVKTRENGGLSVDTNPYQDDQMCHLISKGEGSVYVMNDSGKTVDRYTA